MKPYGRKRSEFGCCPGHDDFPSDSYNSRRSQKAHSKARTKLHKLARIRLKKDLDERISDVSV